LEKPDISPLTATGLNLAFKVSAIARQSAPTDQTRGSESIRVMKKPYFSRFSGPYQLQKLVFSGSIHPQLAICLHGGPAVQFQQAWKDVSH
jgi:hypothetical protein